MSDEMIETASLYQEYDGAAFLVGTVENDESFCKVQENLQELQALVSSLGVPVCGQVIVNIRQYNPSLYIGQGKAAEIRSTAAELGASVIIFDTALGPSQQRNLERACHCKVIDRQEVILDIFAKRAWTREAVLQVELARYRYFLPRLTGAWSHLSRQRGGGTGARGDGEKQIEYDRRYLKQRIGELREELAVVRKQRDIQRKGRFRNGIPNAAIVGYTNAGKSTLLNALTGSDVLAKDQLFATLDPSTRRCILPDHQELLLTDTVGFVRKLPHALVEAFKSTLEEAAIADFILLVLDISSPQVETQWTTTLSVLEELGAADKPMIIALNKVDQQQDPVILQRMRALVPHGIFLSAATGQGLDELKERLICQITGGARILSLEIPPAQSELVALLHRKGLILNSKYQDDGTFSATAKIPDNLLHSFEMYANNETQNVRSSVRESWI